MANQQTPLGSPGTPTPPSHTTKAASDAAEMAAAARPSQDTTLEALRTISNALANLAGELERVIGSAGEATPARRSPSSTQNSLVAGAAYGWSSKHGYMRHKQLSVLPLSLLLGIDRQKQQLLRNTELFCSGLRANNALLWGARGTGKSALIRSVWWEAVTRARHQPANKPNGGSKFDLAPTLVSVSAQNINHLPELMEQLAFSQPHPDDANAAARYIVLLDDFSVDDTVADFSSLKSALQGGLGEQPANVVVYATSNRRHMVARKEDSAGDSFPSDNINDKLALSDRFGLWLGFAPLREEEFLAIVHSYCVALGLLERGDDHKQHLMASAKLWARSRGSLSGRVAWQFVVDFAANSQQDVTQLFATIT